MRRAIAALFAAFKYLCENAKNPYRLLHAMRIARSGKYVKTEFDANLFRVICLLSTDEKFRQN
jgi:hypothetical protein